MVFKVLRSHAILNIYDESYLPLKFVGTILNHIYICIKGVSVKCFRTPKWISPDYSSYSMAMWGISEALMFTKAP